MEYTPLQGCTTLVFGSNLDNDSQGSNGSGKSALIEVFAMALTGDTLRRVNTEEIINDACDDASVSCELTNSINGNVLCVERNISRANPQTIHISLNGEAVVLSSIAEHNRYVLDTIGLSKDDVFSSFILSKHKYVSFLNSPDKAKKDLINRFSNGNLVDESVEHLKSDMAELRERILDAEKRVSHSEGRVATIAEQIGVAYEEQSYKARRKEALITAHQDAITKHRGQIREAKELIKHNEDLTKTLNEIGDNLEVWENDTLSIEECYDRITNIFNEQAISHKRFKDYPSLYATYLERREDVEKRMLAISNEISAQTVKMNEVSELYSDLLEERDVLQAKQVPELMAARKKIEQLNQTLEELGAEELKVAKKLAKATSELTLTNSLLAGAITCPNCSHRFVLEASKSAQELAEEVATLEKRVKSSQKAKAKINTDIATAQASISDERKRIGELDSQLDDLSEKTREANVVVNNVRKNLDRLQATMANENRILTKTQEELTSLRKSLFDEAFDAVDIQLDKAESESAQATVTIKTAEGSIKSYEEAIEDLRNMSASDTIDQLKAQQKAYDKALAESRVNLDSVNAKMAELTQQESRFVEFKTHLANAKIEALGQLTNEFLEKFGSDIRISFSGYTTLKSGKVRDKISISLLRDGIDCGSFAKFSAGEQCRVNLASILALHKLINNNCDDEKGLDLLVLDEILDATDEAGLANMFDALNELRITSMVVSHGMVAESYPYRLTIEKRNGVSTINRANV